MMNWIPGVVHGDREKDKKEARITVFPGGTLTPADKCYGSVLQRRTDEAGPLFD